MYFKLIIYIFFSSLLGFPLFSISKEFKADTKGIDNSTFLRYKRSSNYSKLREYGEEADEESTLLKEKGSKKNLSKCLTSSSIIEHLGIGIYVKMLEIEEGRDDSDKNSKFEYDFKEAFNEFFSHDKYSKAADNLREKIISNYYNGHKAKDVFLDKISKIIGD
uniref:Uncharacterized protein n=1 Tax=Meloidogyne enterolobii TaxID=390850 RepID=A0A6V7WVP9_MELEN|nr:unnamed protein product [Meloidogyne enterolobii]